MQKSEIEVFTLDAKRVNKWLLIACNHYGFDTVEEGLASANGCKIVELATTIQTTVHEAERRVLEKPLSMSFGRRWFGWLNQDF